MVRVSKIAVWDVDGELIRDVKAAEKAARLSIIRELMVEQKLEFDGNSDLIPEWVAESWDLIETRVKAAMAGT